MSGNRRYFDIGFRFIAGGSGAVLLGNAATSLVQSLHKELTEPQPP
jgi:hypothetical protein